MDNDNPWATTWDNHDQEWPKKWPEARNKAWLQGDASWDTAHTQDASSDDRGSPELVAPGDSVSDHQPARSTSPPRDPSDIVPETADASIGITMSVASISDEENPDTVIALHPPEDDWAAPWGSIPSSGTNPSETQAPDQWEAARQEKEKLNRAVPPELLDSLLCHCQQVSQEIWPTSEHSDQDNWKSGFNDQTDISALLAQLLPTDMTLPPAVQFSATATAKAMNEALKLSRHLSATTSSPLSRLLASKGSLEWEKSIKAKQDVVSDTPHVGWRVLEKEDRLHTTEESKPKKATGGLLSFWNRKTSAASPVETPSEQSSSSMRSSLECINSVPHPSRAASPSGTSSSSVSPPTNSPTTVVATAPAASAVSRFLNRLSRARGPQHTSLALSSDDLEFLSDIVPSASDPLDEDIDDGSSSVHTGASNSSPLPPKLPPPISPPPKQLLPSSRPSSVLGFRALNGVSGVGSALTPFQTQSANHTSSIPVPVLAPPLSPRPAASFSHTKSPPLSLKGAATPTAVSGLSNMPQQKFQPGPQLNSSSFILPLPQKTPPLLSVPPLLPPPPVSPPQTPRPTASPSMTPGHSSTVDSHESDDEFSAFESFPPASFPSSKPYPTQEPPSPPPRRTYERTHYPSSSSASSILSPASQTSLDQLCTAGSSISASLDSFDDFVSPLPVVRAEKHTPSPPPLPVKSQFQHPQPLRIDTFSSRVYHAHTPSQKFTSPTVHTNLLNSAFSVLSVSDAEHRRTQSLVDHAAACEGIMWPNSADSDEPRVQAIPPPPTSPKQLLGEESFDLLSGGDTLGGGLQTLPTPPNVVGGVGTGPMVSPSATDALRVPLGVGKGLGLRNQLQSPPMPSTSASMFSFSSLGAPVPLAATNPGSIQPTKPKQMGGLSAQDLSFFEGL